MFNLSNYYILDGHDPVPVTFEKYLEWSMVNGVIHVASTVLSDEVEVSTVFLGLNHSFFGGKRLLFETMIFGGVHNEYQARYATWSGAEAGHLKAVEMARSKSTG